MAIIIVNNYELLQSFASCGHSIRRRDPQHAHA